MKIVEFRIFVPLKVEWCRAAAKYSVNRRTTEESKNGDGFEIVEAGQFNENGVTGRYVHRILHFKNQVPDAVRWAVPEKYSHIHEHNRNAFPHYVANFEIPDIGDKLILNTETKHIDYHSEADIPENIMGFSEAELKKREVIYPDLLNGKAPKHKEFDLHGFSYPPAGIPVLKCKSKKLHFHHIPQWVQEYESGPLCLIIKTVKFRFKWPGIQTLVEKIVTGNVFPDVYLDTHRAMVKWIDQWFNLSEQDLINMENKTKDKLAENEFDD